MRRRGFSIIELILAIGIFAALAAGTVFLAVGSFTPFVGAGNTREMERFAREALEIVKIIKERSWDEFESNDGGANLKVSINSSGNWTFSSGTETRGSFTRAITIATAQRNSSGDIVASAGTVDPATKKIVITVTASGRSDYKLETYVTNWEAYRMLQTDWAGSVNVDIWTSGSTSYKSSSSMDLTTTSGDLALKGA